MLLIDDTCQQIHFCVTILSSSFFFFYLWLYNDSKSAVRVVEWKNSNHLRIVVKAAYQIENSKGNVIGYKFYLLTVLFIFGY